jgi:hypothetical protein
MCTVGVDDGDVQGLGALEQQREGRSGVQAAARGRQMAVELRLRHRRGLELEPLAAGERRGAADEQRHGKYEKGSPSHSGRL